MKERLSGRKGENEGKREGGLLFCLLLAFIRFSFVLNSSRLRVGFGGSLVCL